MWCHDHHQSTQILMGPPLASPVICHCAQANECVQRSYPEVSSSMIDDYISIVPVSHQPSFQSSRILCRHQYIDIAIPTNGRGRGVAQFSRQSAFLSTHSWSRSPIQLETYRRTNRKPLFTDSVRTVASFIISILYSFMLL